MIGYVIVSGLLLFHMSFNLTGNAGVVRTARAVFVLVSLWALFLTAQHYGYVVRLPK